MAACNVNLIQNAMGIQQTGPRTVIVPADPIFWSERTNYEYLTLVASADFGQGYVSKKDVPAGTPLTNTDYWIPVAQFNAQLANIQTSINSLNKAVDKIGWVTPEEFGAVGDGVNDDTNAIIDALQTNRPVVLRGNYKFTSFTMPKGTTIIGFASSMLYAAESETGNLIGDSINFTYNNEGCTLIGVGVQCKLVGPYSLTAIGCNFYGPLTCVSIPHNSSFDSCTFNGCNTAIESPVDCLISNSMFNKCGTGINAETMGDTCISNSKIQWCDKGIVINGAIKYNISNVIFDRNNVAFTLTTGGNISISNCLFERSMNYHMSGSFYSCFVNNCNFIVLNSEDDGSGTTVPLIPFNFHSMAGGEFSNCNFNMQSGQPFNDVSPNSVNTTFNGCTINNIDINGASTSTTRESPGASVSQPLNDVMPFNGYGYYFTELAVASLTQGTNNYIVIGNIANNVFKYDVPSDLQSATYTEKLYVYLKSPINLVAK